MPLSLILKLIYLIALLLLSFGDTLASGNKETLYLDPQDSAAQYIACLDQQGVTLVGAHRGGKHTGYPENSLESMQVAIAYGPMLLEMDVRETADGHLVLLHDDTLERTTTGKGELADYTLAELAEVRLRDEAGTITTFGIPTLESVLDWADNRTIVQLDVKPGVDFAKVAQAVVDADAIDSTLMIAYQVDDAVAAMKVDRRLSFSISVNSTEELQKLEEAGVSRNQIVAWTGTSDGSEKAIWSTLEELGIPDATGAQTTIEAEITKTGDPKAYIELAEAGVGVIAAGKYRLAFDTLATRQDLTVALNACKAK